MVTGKYHLTSSMMIRAAYSRVADCVAIDETMHFRVFVIPGLTRNPVSFQRLTFLDAGSSPA
jgi:hypothetical protein